MPVRNKLYRFALRIVANVEEAEDVVQEVMLRLWRIRDNWSAIQNMEAWCMRMTKNLAIDKARYRKPSASLENAPEPQNTGDNPAEDLEYQDTLARLKVLIGQLPENQRLVIHLRDIEGLSYQEIEETLEMPMSQVKINLFRARQKVREALVKTESYGL
ncbi:MAG TPA: sigma-70 family RNA polymerase sigma factor [Flavilitoribacter sp.]|nr:sigma-70 family RNA polymerase sigma factor [Lewinella sp.]MCB9279095.1 sigma-70 family RNA polymerase sigma factor [Lewinellaceae bacterium]HMQ60364.1 sigma-70 family RNA polymerase sigma factor [Flavilitoribacter sp.]HMQ88840.1 sigma-70 family RNA polymerase sigma factor [Flavilitoribacter sp.]